MYTMDKQPVKISARCIVHKKIVNMHSDFLYSFLTVFTYPFHLAKLQILCILILILMWNLRKSCPFLKRTAPRIKIFLGKINTSIDDGKFYIQI